MGWSYSPPGPTSRGRPRHGATAGCGTQGVLLLSTASSNRSCVSKVPCMRCRSWSHGRNTTVATSNVAWAPVSLTIQAGAMKYTVQRQLQLSEITAAQPRAWRVWLKVTAPHVPAFNERTCGLLPRSPFCRKKAFFCSAAAYDAPMMGADDTCRSAHPPGCARSSFTLCRATFKFISLRHDEASQVPQCIYMYCNPCRNQGCACLLSCGQGLRAERKTLNA